PPPEPALINPDIPPALSMVILRSLAKDPAARFPSASSLSAALAEALNIAVPDKLNPPAYPKDIVDEPTRHQSFSAQLAARAPVASPSTPVLSPALTPALTHSSSSLATI